MLLRCVFWAMFFGIGASQAIAQCIEINKQELTASDERDGDQFGGAVAVNEDLAMVGATRDDCRAGNNCGAAYVYRFDGARWNEEQKLTASDASEGDLFGAAVSISGNTAVVGTRVIGAVYVFNYNGIKWIEQQKLTASDAAWGDQFGISVSITEDTLAVGASSDDCDNEIDCGAVYLFHCNGTSWDETQKITASDRSMSSFFGFAVSASADTVVVGAYGDYCSAGNNCGAAYVFRDNGASWVEEQKLTDTNPNMDEFYGYSVSVSGDTVVVGEHSDICDFTGGSCGAMYVYRFDGISWIEEQRLAAIDAKAGDQFGYAVSISGDSVIVGARLSDCAMGFWCGAAYVFHFDGVTWDQAPKLMTFAPTKFDRVGNSVAMSGETALVGASYSNCKWGFDCGSAYVFHVPAVPVSATVDLDCDGDMDLVDFAMFQAQFSNSRSFVMDNVTVGNPGNPDDFGSVTRGHVNYTYEIGKYEVTVGQYTSFLNAVAATDTYELYSPNMLTHTHGCKIRQIGNPGSYIYLADFDEDGVEDSDWVNRPVNYVSWGNAVRFVNWLHNGQPAGDQTLSTTEDGAYFLNGVMTDDELIAVVREADATWVVPTEDEWYKAAYHYNDGVTGNYYNYTTKSDSLPDISLIEPIDPGNNMTYKVSGYYFPSYTIGSPYWRTEVGAHENSSSPYGTFDQGGNVFEWTEALNNSKYRLVLGSSYNSTVCCMTAGLFWYPTTKSHFTGFRVAQISSDEPISSDVDGDGDVDLFDYASFTLPLTAPN